MHRLLDILQKLLTTVFSGHPAANDCLEALLATTLGFWYFMFDPSEAVASFVASPPSPAPAGIQRQNGFLSGRPDTVSTPPFTPILAPLPQIFHLDPTFSSRGPLNMM